MPTPGPHRRIAIAATAPTTLSLPAATLDLDVPRDGIQCGDDRLLGLDLRSPCGARDHWIRGRDVIAVYKPTDPRDLRATALWRPRPAGAAAAWEVIVSATTGRERSDASLAVISDVAAVDVLWGVAAAGRLRWETANPGAAQGVLLRRPAVGGGGSVFVAGHPAETRRLATNCRADRVQVECWLFSAAAEKGVLFRSRVVAAVGPPDDDLSWAERLWNEFAAAPPMLTA
jgi:hypothetical protein